MKCSRLQLHNFKADNALLPLLTNRYPGGFEPHRYGLGLVGFPAMSFLFQLTLEGAAKKDVYVMAETLQLNPW